MLIPEDLNSRLWNYTDLRRFRDMFNFAVRNRFVTKLNAISTVSFTVKRVIHRQDIYGFRQGIARWNSNVNARTRENKRRTESY
jgi:hypothetical protein